MKKIGFFFSIVLAVFLSTYSYALKNTATPSFETVHQKHFVADPAQGQSFYFSAALLEEDNDDASTEKEKFFSGKNAMITTCFVAGNFSEDFFKTHTFTNHFFNFYQPRFLYIRVLRL